MYRWKDGVMEAVCALTRCCWRWKPPNLIKHYESLVIFAVENEVNEYLESMSSRTNSEGRKQFVRNGYLPEREVQTGIGPIAVKQPRVRDKNGFTKY
ncbi:hypothetical protein WCH_CZ17970 [Waddlia chondrophila 2032/99]|uniref:Uncharacterized protein n=1 Tax=Waddlia chondrophila 2032/99 TaxID=765953 RepID=F8LCQ4_9BACT|nr:hypothetical protein WCH_CZ17970 [Waddlia chondrophila 2032/99]